MARHKADVTGHSWMVQAGMVNVPAMTRKMMTAMAVMVVAAISQLTVAATTNGAMAAQACVDDWAQAAMLIKQRKMIDMARLNRLAREKYSGKILTTRLCRRDGRYFYHLVIRDGSGFAKRVKVDAENRSK